LLDAAHTAEDVVGGFLASRAGLLRLRPEMRERARLLGESLDPDEIAAVRDERFVVLDGREAVEWAARGRRLPFGRALIVVNPPEIFEGVPNRARGRLIADITTAAIRLGATLMVDCTNADLARLEADGLRSIESARGRLWRMVVFDGAHHLPGLALRPEILLAPVTVVGQVSYINHGYVRDAVPWSDLVRTLDGVGTRPVVFALPRLSTPVKSKSPLGVLGREALRIIVRSARPGVIASEQLGGGQVPLTEWAARRGGPPLARVSSGLVRTGEGIALYSIRLTPRRAHEAVSEARRLVAGEYGKTPIRRLWLGVGYGNVTGLSMGRIAMLRQGAQLAAEVGRELPVPAGTVDLPTEVIGLPYSFWDLALLKMRAAIGAVLARLTV
jgi:hypothetical protein